MKSRPLSDVEIREAIKAWGDGSAQDVVTALHERILALEPWTGSAQGAIERLADRVTNVEKWIEAKITAPAPRPSRPVPLELHEGAALQLVIGLLIVGGFVGYLVASYVAASRA